LYFQVAFLAQVNKSAGGSKGDSLLAILIVNKEVSVPSAWRAGQNEGNNYGVNYFQNDGTLGSDLT